jgi:hypothetical protein
MISKRIYDMRFLVSMTYRMRRQVQRLAGQEGVSSAEYVRRLIVMADSMDKDGQLTTRGEETK